MRLLWALAPLGVVASGANVRFDPVITFPVEIMDLNDAAFERVITLRDAYRIMEEFVRGYVERGDFPVSEFLDAYAAETRNGWTTDPAAPADFIAAADQILGAADGGR